jgi:hypothetical protein
MTSMHVDMDRGREDGPRDLQFPSGVMISQPTPRPSMLGMVFTRECHYTAWLLQI